MKKLDLHGVRHHEVRSMVICFVEKYWDTETEVEIVTGYSKRMKDIVMEVLDEYKLEYSDKFMGFDRGYIRTVI